MSKVFDLFIIGGGINDAGIARDAAGRGLSVCLSEKVLLDLKKYLPNTKKGPWTSGKKLV